MLRAQIDNDRDSGGGSGIPEVTFRPLPFAEHRTFAKRSHVKDRKGFDMTYFGSTRVVDQASAHSLPRVSTVAAHFRSSPGNGHPRSRLSCLKRATSGLMHRSKEQATDHRSFWVDAFLARGGSHRLHQFQSAAIRTEAALAAGASGRKPVPYPAAGDSL